MPMQDELLKFLSLPRMRYLRWRELEAEHDLLLQRLSDVSAARTDSIHVSGTKELHGDAGAIKLAELSDEALRARIEYIRILDVVDDFIDEVPDMTSRAILRYRYLLHLKWEDVMQRLNECHLYYSDRHLTRLHERAIREAREIYYNQGGGHQ